MTVIAALHFDGETWIGNDDHAVTARAVSRVGSKWVSLNGPAKWWVGVSGWARAATILREKSSVSHDIGKSPDEIASWIREVLRGDDFKREEHPEPVAFGCDFILANNHRILSIDGTFAVTEPDRGKVFALGCGGAIAQACDYGISWKGAISGEILAPKDRVLAAVSAAIDLDPNCYGGAIVSMLK